KYSPIKARKYHPGWLMGSPVSSIFRFNIVALRIQDRRTGITLYGRVADFIRERIASGMWPEGTRLPTLDALAAQLGVARVTVRQACQLLAAEGLLRSQPGRGTYVERSPKELTLNAAVKNHGEAISEFS